MAKPSTITQWMQQPAKFTDEDRKSAAALLKAYPYFVPARFMEAAEQQKKQPFAPGMMAMMQLYMGNWLLFYTFMQAANSNGAAAKSPVAADQLVATDEELATEEDTIPSYEEEMDIDEMTDPMAGEPEFELGEFDPNETYEEDEDLEIGEIDEEEEMPFGFLAEDMPQVPLLEDEEEEEIPEASVASPNPQPAVEEHPAPATPVAEMPKPQPQPARPTPLEEKPKEESKKEEVKAEPKRQDIPPMLGKQQFGHKEDALIQPIFTEDYFLHQGIQISDKVGGDPIAQDGEGGKSLMVVMSFAEWLNFFKTKNEKDKEEQEDQKALKTMWQKEKLAAALEEENDEIPENVFEMAVNSITQEEGLASESLAEIMVKQGKNDKAIEMYRKLSLRNPHKNAYFANRIDEIIKGK